MTSESGHVIRQTEKVLAVLERPAALLQLIFCPVEASALHEKTLYPAVVSASLEELFSQMEEVSAALEQPVCPAEAVSAPLEQLPGPVKDISALPVEKASQLRHVAIS